MIFLGKDFLPGILGNFPGRAQNPQEKRLISWRFLGMTNPQRMEDEAHMIFECSHPQLTHIRSTFEKEFPILAQKHSKHYKLKVLLTPANPQTAPWMRIGKFVTQIWKTRQSIFPIPARTYYNRSPHHNIEITISNLRGHESS